MDRRGSGFTGVIDSGIITHAQFAQPAFKAGGSEGNEKLGQFRNPGYADTDFSVRKVTPITERLGFELRCLCVPIGALLGKSFMAGQAAGKGS